MKFLFAFLVVVGVGLLTGCGYIGPPQPPALEIPFAVVDLAAGQYGGNIVVQFTLPTLATDGVTLTSIQSAEVVAGPGPVPFSSEAWAASSRHFTVPGAAPGPLTHSFPTSSEWIGKSIVIGVRSTGPKGKVSAWSNLKVLTVNPPLVQPSMLKLENMQRGVGITWSGSGPRYRVLRAVGAAGGTIGKLEPLGETDQPNYLDESTAYGMQYQYRILALGEEFQQSEISDAATITPVDVFPPAVPSGLAASAGPTTIELAWTRNAEPDLQGYNVFRAEEGGMFSKVADLVPTPVYSDTKVQSGKRYRYTISAVDVPGNESARSEEADAVAP